MIRRELKTTDGALNWLLISQVEHARISASLATHWTAADLSPYECDGRQVSPTITDEILAAIAHHDDGWTRWEMTLRLDPAHGRPYSFMNEMPLEDSLKIWSDSVAAALRIGYLAGWMVASHFSELLQDGNHANDNLAAAWLDAIRQERRAWLDGWQQASASHSPRRADRALRLLQACDFLSLWLCCDCPVAANEAAGQVEPFVLHWPEHSIGPYQFTAHRAAAQPQKASEPFATPGGLVTGAPWPFDAEELRLTCAASLTPARHYASSEELLHVRQPVELRWRLVRPSTGPATPK